MMIFDVVKIHDKYSFEIKFNYKLNQFKKVTCYKINSYFFIPNSLDINRFTYLKNNFYNDLKTYIRLQTPVYLMRNIAREDYRPYSKLKQSFIKLSQENSSTNRENYEYFIKMFCSIFQSSIRDNIIHIKKNNIDKNNIYLIENFIGEVKETIKKYRELETIINVPTISKDTFFIYQFGDEYISNIVEKYFYDFFKILSKKKLKPLTEFKKEIFSYIQMEITYRKEKGYSTIPEKNSNNEVFLYRKSVLKKYIDNKLFLNTNAFKEGCIAEQLILSITAGIAMLFATIVAFISKLKFGDLTFQFFFILVISYMFKDRIKEMLRSYLNVKFQKKFFDHKTKIYNDNKKIVGISKESLMLV